MATMLMSMAENLTPPSDHYDPYLMHGGGMGASMMYMTTAAQGPVSKEFFSFSYSVTCAIIKNTLWDGKASN